MERFAFCVEFGGNLWRILIFGEQLEERIVPHFAGAKIGKWFKKLEGGVFKPIDDEKQLKMETNLGISLQLDGLDRDICLKIRLPISLKYQSFGFLQNCPKIAKFVSTIDPSIQGNVHFDIGHLDQNKNFLAFISLQSFNCPSTGNESHQKWSIRSTKDIIVDEREMTEKQCPLNQPEEDGQHFEDVFVCWKIESDSNTFIGYNGNGVNQNKSANQLINYLVNGSLRSFPVEIKLGEWYKIEYCHRNDEIFILNIQPTLDEEKLFKTRVDNGIVQFEVFIRKTPHGFETFEGGVEVSGMPAELHNKSGLIGWCTLEEESKNVLVFCEVSQSANQQKTSQSRAKNNSEMISTNGNSKNSIEGEAATPFPIQNNSKIVSTSANAKFSIKEGGFGRGRPRHDRLLTNLAKVDGKYNDLATLEDHSMANVNGSHEDKIETGIAKVEMAETKETNEEEDELIEIAFPEHLIDFIMKEEGPIAKGVFECELEKSTILVNGIQIVGSSKETMMKCAKYIKTIRDLLIKGNNKKMEEKATNLEDNIEEKNPNNKGQKLVLDKLLDEFHSESGR